MLRVVKQPGNFCSAFIGDQRNPVPARYQFFSQRMRRDHMTASTASREDEMTLYAHRPLHLTT
jgi:hypothetical protein